MADQNIATIPLVSTADGTDGVVVIRGGAPVRVPASVLAPAAPAAEVTQAELDAVANDVAGKMSNTAAAIAAALAATDAAGRAAVRNAGFVSTHIGSAADQTAMLAIANVRQGDTVRRADTGTDWRCDALPSSTLANWRNLGATASVDAASVLTAAQAMDGTQEAAMRAAIGAASAMTTVTVSAAGNFDLTESAHDGRRVIAAVPGVIFTRTTTWGASAVGCILDVDADGTFTFGAGITVPSGCASGSANAAGGSVDLAAVDGTLKSITATASVTASASPVYSYGVTAYSADIGPAITNAQLAEIKIPAAALGGLKVGGMLELRAVLTKVGTASLLGWGVRVGTTYGTSTLFAGANSPAGTPELTVSARLFRDRADPSKLRILPGHGVAADATSTVASTLASVDAAGAFSIYVQGITFTAGDTIRCEFADVTITDPVVIA